jgi:hypothetical protein
MKISRKNFVLASFVSFVLFIVSLVVANYCLADSGQVVHYDFNGLKINAKSFTDQSGNGLNGVNNGAEVVGGVSGTALYFNGKSYASVANNDKLNFGTGDFTVSAWVKTITTSIGEAEGRRDIVDKGDPYNSGYAISSMNNRASSLFGESGRSGYGGYCGTVPVDSLDYNNFICPNDKFIDDGSWHNIVAERQNGLVKIYLDKVLIHKYENSDDVSTADDLIIGRHGEKDESFFRGKIDEITIYNQAIGEDQIATGYQTVLNGYSSSTEAQLDKNLGFNCAKEFDPVNDGNYWYTVKTGDTPWSISESLCGHGEWWKSMINPTDFTDANRNTTLPSGERIKLSIAQCGSRKDAGTSCANEQKQSYVISKGDTLWSIAKNICGSGFAWTKLFSENLPHNLNGNVLIRYGETLNIDSRLCQ